MYITFYLGLSLPFFDFMAFATTIYVIICSKFPHERLVYFDSPESLNSLPSMIFWTPALHFSKAKAYALL